MYTVPEIVENSMSAFFDEGTARSMNPLMVLTDIDCVSPVIVISPLIVSREKEVFAGI